MEVLIAFVIAPLLYILFYRTKDLESQIEDIKDDGSLAYKINKHIHERCKDCPHDMGQEIVEIIKDNLK